MKNINVESKIELSNEISRKNIYYCKILSESETRDFAQKLFKKLGTEIDETRTNIYEDEAMYYIVKNYNVLCKGTLFSIC